MTSSSCAAINKENNVSSAVSENTKTMKSPTLVILAAFAVTFSVADELLEQLKNECLGETGFDKKLTNHLKEEDDPKLKDFIFCVHKKLGLQNKNGDLQPDAIRTQLLRESINEDKISEIFQKCIDKKDTPQETGYQFLKCSLAITHSKQ